MALIFRADTNAQKNEPHERGMMDKTKLINLTDEQKDEVYGELESIVGLSKVAMKHMVVGSNPHLATLLELIWLTAQNLATEHCVIE
jgi:hypothetical protein